MQIAGAGGAAALAQVRHQMFSRLDGNGDGTLGLGEFRSGVPARAVGADATGAPRAESLFAAIDGDSDGSVTRAEFETAFSPVPAGMREALLRLQDHRPDAAESAGTANSAGSDLPSTLMSALQSYLTAGLKGVAQVAGTALSLAV